LLGDRLVEPNVVRLARARSGRQRQRPRGRRRRRRPDACRLAAVCVAAGVVASIDDARAYVVAVAKNLAMSTV